MRRKRENANMVDSQRTNVEHYVSCGVRVTNVGLCGVKRLMKSAHNVHMKKVL